MTWKESKPLDNPTEHATIFLASPPIFIPELLSLGSSITLKVNNSLLWESTLDIVGSLVASLNTSNFQLPSCDKQKCLQMLPHVWDKFTPR